jgi:hypothetical protein
LQHTKGRAAAPSGEVRMPPGQGSRLGAQAAHNVESAFGRTSCPKPPGVRFRPVRSPCA